MKKFQGMRNSGVATFFFATILTACSSSPKISPEYRGRAPASVAAKFGLACIANAEVFRGFDHGYEMEKELDQALESLFAPLSGAERERALALALAESYAYGQHLLGEYESLIDRGYPLERIMRVSSVYSELQALFFIRHDLERYAKHEFSAAVVDRLMSESGGAPERGIFLIQDASAALLTKWHGYLSERSDESAYATAAFAELESAAEELNATAAACGSGALPDRHVTAPDSKVISAVRSLKKNPNAYRLFQSPSKLHALSVASIVRERGRAVQREWRHLISRTPQATTTDKVFYPSVSRSGNIFGTNFPKKIWALTFDDGPHGGTATRPSFTKEVLANLKKHEMHASFFILSQNLDRRDCPGVVPRVVRKYGKDGKVLSEKTIDIRKDRPGRVFPELALAERDQGHAVNSHSYYHSELPKDVEIEQECEINVATQVFTDQMGARPDFFRLPYGAGVNIPSVRAKIAAGNMIHVYWNVDTLDWQDHDPQSIYVRAVKQIKTNGQGVILFHDIHPQSVIASELVMNYLKDPANGLETVTIPEIVDRMNAAGAVVGSASVKKTSRHRSTRAD